MWETRLGKYVKRSAKRKGPVAVIECDTELFETTQPGGAA